MTVQEVIFFSFFCFDCYSNSVCRIMIDNKTFILVLQSTQLNGGLFVHFDTAGRSLGATAASHDTTVVATAARWRWAEHVLPACA